MQPRAVVVVLVSVVAFVGCATPPADEEQVSGDSALAAADSSPAEAKCRDSWNAAKATTPTLAGRAGYNRFMSECLEDEHARAASKGLRIALASADLPSTAPTGESWEQWGRLPNAQATLTLDIVGADGKAANVSATGDAASETLSPKLDTSVILPDGAVGKSLVVTLTDSAWGPDTTLASCTIDVARAGLLAEGVHDADCGASVKLHFEVLRTAR
jgi:hypothetical protein